jgi:uncharacterized alpha-E superfamily protein
VWVLASEPERDTGALLAGDQLRLMRRDAMEVPGRAADNLFWVGRYAERADGAARVLRQVLRRFLDPEVPSGDPQLRSLLALTTRITGTYPGFIGAAAPPDPDGELHSLLADPRRTGSLRFTLKALARAARAVRDRLSPDAWRTINALDCEFEPPADSHAAADLLEHIGLQLAALGGLIGDTMSRGQGWRFLEIGRRLERALLVLTAVRGLCPPADPRGTPWDDLLAVAGSAGAQLRRAPVAPYPSAVLDLLLDDDTNPRSATYQLVQLASLLHGLSGEDLALQHTAEERLLRQALDDLQRTAAVAGAPARQLDGTLEELLAGIETRLATLSDCVSVRYFSRGDRPQQLVALSR